MKYMKTVEFYGFLRHKDPVSYFVVRAPSEVRSLDLDGVVPSEAIVEVSDGPRGHWKITIDFEPEET